MRLINVHTLELRQFARSDVPVYAALSHRWGRDEVNLEDLANPERRNGDGFRKIQNVCHEVRSWHWSFKRRTSSGRVVQHRDELVHWVCIDTCCIDKRNFTEYSEAINSMWAWYKRAAFCIVYLADVKGYNQRRDTLAELEHSEWFERGWTLQELLAPQTLFFYSKEWRQIGSSAERDLMESVGYASNIPPKYLGNRSKRMTDISVAKRMSWASSRRTTVPEDLAYCLIGIFDVNMTLVYGEEFPRAFERLQRTIINHCDDESIFAFAPRKGHNGVLATSPRDFVHCGNVIKLTRQERPAYSIGNRGLQFDTPAYDVGGDYPENRRSSRRYAIELNCAKLQPDSGRPVMCTLGLRKQRSRYARDPEIERRFDATSRARAETKLVKGTWRWTSSRRFYIHTAKSGRSRRRSEQRELPEVVSGVFTKGIRWLARLCPLHALDLTGDPSHDDRRGRRSQSRRHERKSTFPDDGHDRRHRSVPRRDYRYDDRYRRSRDPRDAQRRTRDTSRRPGRDDDFPARRERRTFNQQRSIEWKRAGSPAGLSSFPLKQQWHEYHTMRGGDGGIPVETGISQHPLDSRLSRSRFRSDKPRHWGNSGHDSIH